MNPEYKSQRALLIRKYRDPRIRAIAISNFSGFADIPFEERGAIYDQSLNFLESYDGLNPESDIDPNAINIAGSILSGNMSGIDSKTVIANIANAGLPGSGPIVEVILSLLPNPKLPKAMQELQAKAFADLESHLGGKISKVNGVLTFTPTNSSSGEVPDFIMKDGFFIENRFPLILGMKGVLVETLRIKLGLSTGNYTDFKVGVFDNALKSALAAKGLPPEIQVELDSFEYAKLMGNDANVIYNLLPASNPLKTTLKKGIDGVALHFPTQITATDKWISTGANTGTRSETTGTTSTTNATTEPPKSNKTIWIVLGVVAIVVGFIIYAKTKKQ